MPLGNCSGWESNCDFLEFVNYKAGVPIALLSGLALSTLSFQEVLVSPASWNAFYFMQNDKDILVKVLPLTYMHFNDVDADKTESE